MASFPGSVKTYPTRSAGQTIEAAHINELGDEVTAIEDGYRNATAPLNSSNSTVNALSVVAGSTFAVRPILPLPEMALVFLQSTVTLGSSGDSTLAWTGQAFVSTATMHSTAILPERLVPQTTGLYQFSAQVAFNVAGVGIRQVLIEDSSGGSVGTQRIENSTASAVTISAMGYKRYDATGGHCVVRVVMSGNSTLSLSTGAGVSWFAMQKLL